MESGVWGLGGRERGEVCGRRIGSSLKRLYQRAVILAHVLIGKKERGYSVIGCLIDSVHLTANLLQKKRHDCRLIDSVHLIYRTKRVTTVG